jgi:hypothetical protein
MHKVALVLALSAPVVLSAACVADVSDDPEAVEESAEPVKDPTNLANLVPGPCATACLMIAAGRCGRWPDECADNYPYDKNVDCGTGVALSCIAAQYADQDTAVGVTWCYRDCAGLR